MNKELVFEQQLNDIINGLKKQNFITKNKYDDEYKVVGIVLMDSGSLGALIDHNCYCINEIRCRKDGSVYISEYSVGGNVINKAYEKLSYINAKEDNLIRSIYKVWDFESGETISYATKEEIISILDDFE